MLVNNRRTVKYVDEWISTEYFTGTCRLLIKFMCGPFLQTAVMHFYSYECSKESKLKYYFIMLNISLVHVFIPFSQTVMTRLHSYW